MSLVARGIWVPMAQKVLRSAVTAGIKVSRQVRSHVSAATTRVRLHSTATYRSSSHYLSGSGRQHPTHPIALRRQLRRNLRRFLGDVQASTHRFFNSQASSGTTARRFVDRAAYLQTRVGTQAVWKATGRTPFASTLRPNLTGGAMPRTAGGYSFGGSRNGARYFSHAPTASAQVVQNVSQAMRAFWLSGQRARFDGVDGRGRPCYRAISALEEDVARKMAVPRMPKMAPGSFVDFSLQPTITALASAKFGAAATAAATPGATLAAEGFLDVLSVDFSRALKEYAAVMNDLRKLAGLGDLPVLLEGDSAVLRVRFPGVDRLTVDRLCEDLGVTRGVVGQDPGFEFSLGGSALRFPFAPDAPAVDGQNKLALSSPGRLSPGRSHPSALSLFDEDEYSDDDDEFAAYYFDVVQENPWLSSLPSTSSKSAAGGWHANNDDDGYGYAKGRAPKTKSVHTQSSRIKTPAAAVSSGVHASDDFDEGLQGIYRFVEECDRMKGRF